jgi:hypothetical protein
VLRGFFALLFLRALIEFKSKAAPFAPGDLHGLIGRGGQYYWRHRTDFTSPKEFVLFLLVPSITQALRDEVREIHGSLRS